MNSVTKETFNSPLLFCCSMLWWFLVAISYSQNVYHMQTVISRTCHFPVNVLLMYPIDAYYLAHFSREIGITDSSVIATIETGGGHKTLCENAKAAFLVPPLHRRGQCPPNEAILPGEIEIEGVQVSVSYTSICSILPKLPLAIQSG